MITQSILLSVIFIAVRGTHSFHLSSSHYISPMPALKCLLSQTEQTIILAPPEDKVSDGQKATAVILIPGCQLQPAQYKEMATKIQEQSDQAVWISIPKVFMDAPNPVMLPNVVRNAMTQLQDAGYAGSQAFIGGHSLGGVFLSDIVNEKEGLKKDEVLGFIRLGAFQQRDDDSENDFPQLTLCGDLDGMVRTSRIAEDFHHNIIAKGDTEETRLFHSTVLVKGMNHFAFLSGKAPFMKQFRDLETEISVSHASSEVSSAIAEFIDTHHRSRSKAKSLLNRVERTHQYIEPMLEAMELEGSYHINTPSFEDEGKADAEFNLGSKWAVAAQQSVAPELPNGLEYETVKNEFHRCWFADPLAEVPFYHPTVERKPHSNYVQMNTVSELVYDPADGIFDGGFFSNAPSEIRCKFNSAESILRAAGIEESEATDSVNVASRINANTIEWALSKVPEEVRRRYLERGVQLMAGNDVEKTSGPAWIWSTLKFRAGTDEAGRDVRFLDSPTMNTSIDHPIPHAGGKMYCKLLSPSKALDWIYTDSLRSSPNFVESLVSSLLPEEPAELVPQ